MLEEHFAGKLDRAAFPYIGAPPPPVPIGGSMRAGATAHAAPTAAPASLRSARPRWTAASGKAGSGGGAGARNEPPRQRVIVFVAGGMTYSEIRTAYQLSEALGKDVVVGSTHVITPESFIDDLSNLDRPPPKPRPTAAAPPQPSTGASLAPPRPQPQHTNSAPDVRAGSSSRPAASYGEPLHHARSAQPPSGQQPPRPYGNAPPSDYARSASPRPSVTSNASTAPSSASGGDKPKKKGLFSRK